MTTVFSQKQRAGEFREHLGDGAYVDFDGFHVRLYCHRSRDSVSGLPEQPGQVVHWVGLEPAVWASLLAYKKRLDAFLNEHAEELRAEVGDD